jgi:hypothetical protein
VKNIIAFEISFYLLCENKKSGNVYLKLKETYLPNKFFRMFTNLISLDVYLLLIDIVKLPFKASFWSSGFEH